jgi:hypothetical protein
MNISRNPVIAKAEYHQNQLSMRLGPVGCDSCWPFGRLRAMVWLDASIQQFQLTPLYPGDFVGIRNKTTHELELHELSLGDLRQLADKLEGEIAGRAKNIIGANAVPAETQAVDVLG